MKNDSAITILINSKNWNKYLECPENYYKITDCYNNDFIVIFTDLSYSLIQRRIRTKNYSITNLRLMSHGNGLDSYDKKLYRVTGGEYDLKKMKMFKADFPEYFI